MFVDAEIYDHLQTVMLCGLTPKRIGKINLAKFSAYYSLYSSATNKVTTPRICVIQDYEYTLKNQIVDWIYTNSDDELDVERKLIDFDMNAFDGSGMISPEMAMKWQSDLSLDYLPSSFILRSAWIKGLVSIFDFRKFAKEVAHKETITDLWGTEYNINNIDVILTKSQFKMAKKYSSWNEYTEYHHRLNHIFGVARVNKKESDFVTPLNYQYIQSNSFTEESIKNLARPTTDWLSGVLRGDPVYTQLLMIGCHEDKSLDEIENGIESPIAKCLMYNQDVLKDEYVKRKIYQIISKKIDQAKIGKLYVEGSYDFLIPDLYAMAEHAFGMEVHGLLPAKSMWSKRWVDKGATKVSSQRSPLVAPGENVVLNIYNDDKCQKWFKYLPFGNVYNIWDMTTAAQSDCDYDGKQYCCQ